MNWSYWEKNTFLDNIDIVIIGSGIVGLSAAIYLKEQAPNLKITILERGVLPTGASTRNAGFACFGSMSELLDDLNNSPKDEVLRLVEKRWKGLQRLRQRVGDDSLHFQQIGGYELFWEKENYNNCADNMLSLNKELAPIIGQPKVFIPANDKINTFGFKQVKNLILNQYEGQINTGKMMKALIDKSTSLGIEIFNGANVTNIEEQAKNVLIRLVDNTSILCKKVLLATNGFTKRLLPNLKINPTRNQVMISKPIPNLPIRGTFHAHKGYYYFRNVDNRILFGGGRHLDFDGESTDIFGSNTNIRKHLIKILGNTILPDINFTIDYWWSGILGVGNSKTPIIKKISPNISIAARLGGMGVAIGSLVGEEGAQLVLEQI